MRFNAIRKIQFGGWGKKMIRVKTTILFAIMLLFFEYSYGQKISPKTVDTKFISSIKQIDFKNFSYVKQGKNKTQSHLMKVTYGDLTGDGIEEAIVLLRGQDTRISRTLDEVFVYSLKNGKVSELAHLKAGQRGDYILSIESLGSNFKIEERHFILDQAILREGEYVPTHFYTVKYRWNGIQMEETERSCLKPLPENMRETG
jgi:hypothetical protein